MGSVGAYSGELRPTGSASRSPAASGGTQYSLLATQDRMDSLAEKLLDFEDVPYGGWKDGLFDCCSNFFPSCKRCSVRVWIASKTVWLRCTLDG